MPTDPREEEKKQDKDKDKAEQERLKALAKNPLDVQPTYVSNSISPADQEPQAFWDFEGPKGSIFLHPLGSKGLGNLYEELARLGRVNQSGDPPQRPAAPQIEFIDDYKIDYVVGTGGFGHVYHATDPWTGHPVAIKIPREDRPDHHWTKTQLQAGQRINHPNVVSFKHYGKFNGLQYLVTEFVEGPSLADWLKKRDRENLVPIRAAVSLMVLLASGMECCHANGVVHRDLNPANVLLQKDPASGTIVEGLDERLIPRITDFGLAREVDANETDTLFRAGTRGYMAPEQAEGRRNQGFAVDIHALGVIFYELLTGTLPYRGESEGEIYQRLLYSEPRSPRLLRYRLPRDLDTICLKCLQKDPSRRYATAAELKSDLEAFLEGRPISARPISRLERMARWAKRKPTEAILSAVAGLASLALVTGTVVFVSNLAIKDKMLEDRNRKLSGSLVASELGEAQRWEADKKLDHSSQILFDLHRELASNANRFFAFRALWHRLDRRVSFIRTDQNHIGAVSLVNTPDGPRLALGDDLTKKLAVWDPISRRQLAHAHHAWEKIQAVAGSPPRLFVLPKATRSPSGHHTPAGDILVFDLESLELIASFPPPEWYDLSVFIAPMSDGRLLLASADSHNCEIRDLQTFKVLDRPSVDGACRTLAVSPQRDRMALTVEAEGQMWLELLEPTDHGYQTRRIAGPFVSPQRKNHRDCSFYPDGEHVLFLTGGEEAGLHVTDLKSGITNVLAERHVDEFCLSPNGQLLATSAKNGGIEIKNAGTGELIQKLETTGFFIIDLIFASDSKTLYSVTSEDPRVWIWHLDKQGKLLTNNDPEIDLSHELGGQEQTPVELNCVCFSPDSRQVAIGGEPGAVWLAPRDSIQAGKALRFTGNGVTAMAYLDGGRKLAVADWQQPSQIKLVDLATGQIERTLNGHERAVRALAVSPDGKTLASGSRDSTVRIWNLTQPNEPGRIIKRVSDVHEGNGDDARCLAFSPDGRFLAMGDNRFERTVYDLKLDREVYHKPGSRSVQAVAFSPKGDQIAFGDGSGTITLLSWPGQQEQVIRAHEGLGGVLSLAFHPNGQELASGGDDGTVAIWNVLDRRPLLRDKVHTGEVRGVAFAPDGATLASVDEKGFVRLLGAPDLMVAPKGEFPKPGGIPSSR